MTPQELIALIQNCGADHAAYLQGESVVTDPAFRKTCESNTCGRFDRCYMCPPDIGDIDSLIGQVKRYPKAVLYQTKGYLEDSFDFEGMIEAGKLHSLWIKCCSRSKIDPDIIWRALV